MDDNAIIALYWSRDQRAIPATSEKYSAYCAAIAKNILGNPEDTEECVNDTYLAAWNAMPPTRPNRLSAFLGRITRNLAFNRYQSDHAKKRGNGEITCILDELAELLSGADDVAGQVEARELLGAINAFLWTLSPRKRRIFVCRYWYSDSVGDIAARYHMRPDTVSMTLHRLRASLQKYLQERGFTL